MAEGDIEIRIMTVPTTLGEFLDMELEMEKEVAEIDDYNLKVVRQTHNETLAGYYGGEEELAKIVGDHHSRIQRFEEAKERLDQGDYSNAMRLLDQRIEELSEWAARNVELTGVASPDDINLRVMNSLRSFRDYLSPQSVAASLSQKPKKTENR